MHRPLHTPRQRTYRHSARHLRMGALNALFFLPLLLTNTNRNNLEVVAQGKVLPSLKELFSILFTFSLTVFAWVFFRAENLSHAIQYVSDLFKHPGSFLLLSNYTAYAFTINLLVVFLVFEWLGRQQQYAIENISFIKYKTLRWTFYFILIYYVFFNSLNNPPQEFIYFDF